MKNAWIYYSITAALLWGVWGIVAKFISSEVNPYENHVLFTLGMLLTLPLVWRQVVREKPEPRGVYRGLGAGALAIAGNVSVFQAFSLGGLAAIVIPFTNLYPLVTIGVAVLVFKERLNALNIMGIVLALPAVILLSGQHLLFEDPHAFLAGFRLEPWLYFSIGSLVLWGLFSAAQKVTTNYLSAAWAYLTFAITSAAISVGFMVTGLAHFNFSLQTTALGALAGLLNSLGVLVIFGAYKSGGKASKVTTIAGALQPAFTILLALLLLHEHIGGIEVLGIIVAITAALLLSGETKTKEA